MYEIKQTHMKAYEAYMAKWGAVTSTLLEVERPTPKIAAKIILDAIRPTALQKRIKSRTWSGLGPEILSDKAEKWRTEVKQNTKHLRRLIREHADYWDRMGFKEHFAEWGTRHVEQPPAGSAPICKAVGCNNETHLNKKYKTYFSYCLVHKGLSAKYNATTTSTQQPTTTPAPAAGPSHTQQPTATTAPTTEPSNTTTTMATAATTSTEASHANTQQHQPRPVVRVDGADQVDTGLCLRAGCDKKRRVAKSGNILVTCGSDQCFQKWGEEGPSHDKQPCWACGSAQHQVLHCPHLNDDNVSRLKENITGYEHTYAWWHDVNHIATARKLLYMEASNHNIGNAATTHASMHMARQHSER